MALMIDLPDGVMTQPDLGLTTSDRLASFAVPRACDGCGKIKPDVDLFAENHETGEELWLCPACGEA